jgi:GT2 family glycosyltransferase
MPENIIPVIGTAIVNSPHWVKRLIESVDYFVDTFVVFNNNGRDEITNELNSYKDLNKQYIKNIKICHLPTNVGCPCAWNLIIKSYLMSSYWVIANHDVAFTPGLLQKMYELSLDETVGIVHGENNGEGFGKWDLFLIKDWVVQKVGLFDENFYPAYVEDFDYIMRLIIHDIKTAYVNQAYLHGNESYSTTGSQTWRSDLTLKDKIDYSRYINEQEYILQKWGPDWRNYKPYKTPFNKEQIPTSYTTFDLQFVRKKYLGF